MGANDEIMAVAAQSDGKLVIGGSFTSFNGTNQFRIARLNPDGGLDTTFNIGGGADGPVSSIWVLDDDRVVIAGSFYHFDGVARTRLARLHADGGLDTNYDLRLSNGPPASLPLIAQHDGTVFGFDNFGSGSFAVWKRTPDSSFAPFYFGLYYNKPEGGTLPAVASVIAQIDPQGKLVLSRGLSGTPSHDRNARPGICWQLFP
jgi:uncharacterized delta-60 repeat protein